MSANASLLHPVRFALVIISITIWALIVLARLGQLQISKHEEFVQLAQDRQQVTRPVLAPRGIIYDCHMDELASSVTVKTVAVEPRRIKDIDSAAGSLGLILGLNPGKLRQKMSDPARRSFLIVKRRIDPRDEARIEALGIQGTYLQEDSMRVYPNRELACHVLGFINMEGEPGGGVELQYDNELRGTQGQLSFNVDAHGRSFHGKVEKAPVQGHSLVLSLDKSIQYLAERELGAGVQQTQAASGIAIVMEPDSGRILALANYPNFNSNLYNEAAPSLWRNKAVSDLFEPGSTFKVVVAAAALQAGLTRPDELIDCEMGRITMSRHVFHDHKPYGLLTFRQVLENSSNIGAAKLGLRLGEQRLYDALREFGFGSKTGIDLPGEIVGLVRECKDWSALSIGAISFGQEVGVTSVQILRAINVIANGGNLVKPTIVDRVIDANGDLVRVTRPDSRRIMSTVTAAALSEAFEGVVLRGTGRRAAIEGYRCAGKTGTAQKIIDGRYSDTRYLASFVGFAPLPAPRITVLVQIDEPKGTIYGGDVAAPIFGRIVQETLIQLKVPPDESVTRPPVNPILVSSSRDYFPNATPVAPILASAEAKPGSDRDQDVVVAAGPDSLVMPDFQGLAKRDVIRRCQELGIRLQMRGSGTAVSQDPPPGTLVAQGDTCSVRFTLNPGGSPIPIPQGNGAATASAQSPSRTAVRHR
jgi:cell division protein FtsI (penicillin-binding protein 3)